MPLLTECEAIQQVIAHDPLFHVEKRVIWREKLFLLTRPIVSLAGEVPTIQVVGS